jgi:excisionase family DNA binding protein
VTVPEKLLLTVREAASVLGVSRSSLYVVLSRGELTSVLIGSSRRVPVAALRAYVDGLLGERPSTRPTVLRS